MVAQPLASWNDGPTKQALLDFAAHAAQSVPAGERIAVFDNDGTLWCERPAYVQALFLLQRLQEQAGADPALAANPVAQALLKGDLHAAAAQGLGPMAEVLLSTHAGLTAEEFAQTAAAWLQTAPHPQLGRPCAELVYAPMLEVMALLRERGFRVFIVTGGGVEFVRAASERLYGVAPDDVVGSAVEVELERRDGGVVLVRQARLRGSPNEGAPKVANIQAHVGRRPIFAAGNSVGDREMLEYATTGTAGHPSLALVVDHDDADREFAYEGRAMTDPTAEPIGATAERAGWTVVSIRDDWRRIFPDA